MGSSNMDVMTTGVEDYIIPMGSSNMDVMSTGDVEAQQHYPNWFADHKHALRPNQDVDANKLGYFILKVPEFMRQPSEVFSPMEWRFGLHNRENLDCSGSEALKLGLAVQYGLVGEKWDNFCDAIVDDPKAMLACYGLQNEVTNWTDEQIKHVLALDALFLADYIDDKFPKNEQRLWISSPFNANHVFHAKLSRQLDLFFDDLWQVENQIPFVLIGKVVQYINTHVASSTTMDSAPHIDDIQYQQRSFEIVVRSATESFMDTANEAFKIGNQSPVFGEKTHILGAAYKTICGSASVLMNQSAERSAYICFPSAIKLKQSSIKIVGVDERSAHIRVPSATKLMQSSIKIVGVNGPLCKMSYEKKCLCLPKMNIYTCTMSFVRNMAWYERYERNSDLDCYLFHDYILLLCDLIQTPEDLDLLIRHGVIDNACGIKGFEMWISLKEGLVEMPSSQRHYDMKVAIVRRCSFRRYRLWSEFKIVFCSKPWVVLSTIAVVLVTMATLVQTYIAIIGSNKMRPKFP